MRLPYAVRQPHAARVPPTGHMEWLKAHLHIERETRNRANLRETRGDIPTTHKARNRAGYENQP